MNSLAFSEEEAISASKKVSPLKSTRQPDSVINLLKQSGLDETHIKNIVISVPAILSKRAESTLKPKMQAFHDCGFSASQLADVLSSTSVIQFRDTSSVKPAVEVLKTYFGNNEEVIDVVKRSQWMLSRNVCEFLLANIVLLRSYGVSEEKIKQLIGKRPRSLVHRTDGMEEILNRVEFELGIPRDSAAMFARGFEALSSISQKTLESNFQVYESYGWSKCDIMTMARKHPYCLASSEAKIRSQLDFFMKELGYEPAYLANRPTLMKFSLEKRVLPRIALVQGLKERKLIDANCCFYTLLMLSESAFRKRFLVPFEGTAPDLCKDYIDNSNGSSLKAVVVQKGELIEKEF